MVKRRNKVKKVRAAKKKAGAVKRLKLKGRAARPAAKKVARHRDTRTSTRAETRAVARSLLAKARKVAAPKAAAKGAAPARRSRQGQRPRSRSAKAALELLEAKVAEVKTKGKRGRGGRRGGKDAWLIPAELPKEDAETRRTRLKNLIKLGKERGFLTYAEINDHLPDDLVDAEQIESHHLARSATWASRSTTRRRTRRRCSSPPTRRRSPQPDEDVEEQAEAALSTVDSEFGRTTDPVRMYMREMGSVELLTREGEIEIAKRIEDGLRHMIQAISACPTTMRRSSTSPTRWRRTRCASTRWSTA